MQLLAGRGEYERSGRGLEYMLFDDTRSTPAITDSKRFVHITRSPHAPEVELPCYLV